MITFQKEEVSNRGGVRIGEPDVIVESDTKTHANRTRRVG